MPESSPLAMLAPLRNTKVPNLKRGWNSDVPATKGGLLYFIPEAGFNLRFLLSLGMDSILKSQFT